MTAPSLLFSAGMVVAALCYLVIAYGLYRAARALVPEVPGVLSLAILAFIPACAVHRIVMATGHEGVPVLIVLDFASLLSAGLLIRYGRTILARIKAVRLAADRTVKAEAEAARLRVKDLIRRGPDA